MKKTLVIGTIIFGAAALAAPWTKGPEENRPSLFKSFGDIANTPEGLALDKNGNLYLSAINGVDPTYSGHIWKRDAQTGNWSVFAVTRTDTKSGKSFPQGIVFGDDGHLYYAENQYFADRNYASSVRRIVIEDGEPLRCETVVEHAMLPNGLRWRDGALYFSESFAHHNGKFGGALYRIPATALRADKPVRLLDKNRMEQDPYCLGFIPTRLAPRNGIDPLDDKVHIYTAGPDGIDFDADGNLYTGSFGDGRFWRLKASGDGKFGKPELLDDKTMTCCDGIVYDKKNNRILCTAAAQNALYAWDVAKERMELFWANGDNDGADGLLDQPSELLYLPDGRLVVVNIDAPSPGMINTAPDAVHTLSVILPTPGQAPSLKLISPRNGAVVPILTDAQKEFYDQPRVTRVNMVTNVQDRARIAKIGTLPRPVRLSWTATSGSAFKPKFTVSVTRKRDGLPVALHTVVRNHVDIYNLETATEYIWTIRMQEADRIVATETGCFTVEDRAPRFIRVNGVPSFRDLGGRIGLGGRRVKQNLVFRSTGLNSNAKHPGPQHPDHKPVPGRTRLSTEMKAYFVHTLGIRTDIDLRTDKEVWGMTGSPAGKRVKWVHVSGSAYGGMQSEPGKKAFAQHFRVFLDRANYPINFHCIAGADRTGSLAFILNGLLGVDEEELWKDWETHTFFDTNPDFRHLNRVEALSRDFNAFPGKTFAEKVEAYVISCGFTREDVALFREIMLEE